jgi:hypothetical protein
VGQPSAIVRARLQFEQTAPVGPHCVAVRPTQLPFATAVQQPVVQLDGSQMHDPLEQRWPPTHATPNPQVQTPAVHVSVTPVQATHALPSFPQAEGAFAWQWLVASQQPEEQEVASHTHAPPEQRWPLAHGAFAPQ